MKNSNEERIEKELLRSWESLFIKKENPRLLNFLLELLSGCASTYVLNWIPEQGENIYELLVSEQEVLIVEIPKADNLPLSVRSILMGDYLNRVKSKQKKLRLSIAMRLIKNSSARCSREAETLNENRLSDDK